MRVFFSVLNIQYQLTGHKNHEKFCLERCELSVLLRLRTHSACKMAVSKPWKQISLKRDPCFNVVKIFFLTSCFWEQCEHAHRIPGWMHLQPLKLLITWMLLCECSFLAIFMLQTSRMLHFKTTCLFFLSATCYGGLRSAWYLNTKWLLSLFFPLRKWNMRKERTLLLDTRFTRTN